MTRTGWRQTAGLLTMAAIVVTGWRVEAGGPLFVFGSKAIVWADHDVRGGPLDSATVAVSGHGTQTVFYRVDSGPLGPLSNADAVRLTDRIFSEYTQIPTASIKFANAGPIIDPDTRAPMDVDATNIGKVLDDLNPTFQNPIIFDADGSITGGGGVLGFFGVLAFEPDFSAVDESFIVLNGAALLPPHPLSTTSFLGVFTHEFGHFAGPLDHAQINGGIARSQFDAAMPEGLSAAAGFDLFAPFVETMFPFLIGAPSGSAAGFPDSGAFIASLDRDTINALSNLYPNLRYRLTSGSIEGQVVLNDRGDRILVDGINVVARRISAGPYPPDPATQAFPTPPVIDADGVPGRPPFQPATDSLATVSSAVTGLEFGRGAYRIQGLPLGFYEVMLQEIYPGSIGGSGIGPLGFQLPLPHVEEYFREGRTSNVVSKFTPVLALPTVTRRKVDLEINGFAQSPVQAVQEIGLHNTIASAQALGPIPLRLEGEAADRDPAGIFVNLGAPPFAPIQDVYKFTLTAPSTLVWISLEGTPGTGDIDLYLLRSSAVGVITPSQILRSSLTETTHELVGAYFGPGTFYVAVSAFQGDVKYKLRILPMAQ